MYQILRDYNTTFREISLDSNYSILIVIKLSTTFFFHVHVLVLKVHQHRFSSLSGIVRNGAPGDVIVLQNNIFFYLLVILLENVGLCCCQCTYKKKCQVFTTCTIQSNLSILLPFIFILNFKFEVFCY